jgi:hypothetical protein
MELADEVQAGEIEAEDAISRARTIIDAATRAP